MSERSYHIAIVGAGPVGLAMAGALCKLGIQVSIFDHLPCQSTADLPTQGRPISLNAGSCEFLKSWGLWPSIAAWTQPIEEVQVSQQSAFGVLRFQAATLSLPALGYMLPFATLKQAMLNHVMQEAAVYGEVHIDDVDCTEDGVTLHYSQSGKALQCKADILVVADGQSSALCQKLGLQQHMTTTDAVAVTGYVVAENKNAAVAYQRLTDDGIWALLPGEQSRNFVWTMPQSCYDKVQDWSEQEWLIRLQQVWGQRVGCFTTAKAQAHFPLQQQYVDNQAGSGFVVVGNAAHTMLPIAAQGMNLSFYGLQKWCAYIAKRQQASLPLATAAPMQSVLAMLEKRQKTMRRFTRGAHWASEWQGPCARILRGKLLYNLDCLPGKEKLIHLFAGTTGVEEHDVY